MNMRFLGYHGVLVGLNYWPTIIKIAMVAIVIAGFLQYYKNGGNQVKRRYNERMFIFISAIFSVAFTVAFFIECAEGIIKYFDMHLAMSDSEAWPVILMPFVVMSAGFFLCVALTGLGKLVGYATKLHYLK